MFSYTMVSLSSILIFYLLGQFSMTDINVVTNVSLINDNELQNVAEELFSKSSHELYRHVTINYQGKTSLNNFSDNAPARIFNVSPEIFSTPTTKSLIKLFDNYEVNTNHEEITTKEEKTEINDFINNLMATHVMLHTMHFLSGKGFFANDLKDFKEIIRNIWFHPYSRSKGINGSSGFEHVFLVEKKPRKGTLGLHNWIYFTIQESLNKLDYFGYSRNIEFNGKAAIAKIYFIYGKQRKMSTIFIGTTPELEIALYTLCFFTRPNKKCKVSFTGINFSVQTYIMKSDGKELIAAAYPIL